MALALSYLGNLGSNLGPRSRKVLRYVGLAVLAVVTFVFAFQLTFPFDRVNDKIVEALSDKYDVTIGGVERGIVPGRVYFKAFSLRTRPTKATDVATTFYMEQLEVDVGLFALLRGAVSVKLDAKIGRGHIKGKLTNSSSNLVVQFTGEDLPSASLPVRELGLPMSGKVQFTFDLDVPYEKPKSGSRAALNFTKAEGRAEFSCPSGCTIGDGKSKLKLTTNNARQQAFLDEGGGGIDFGKVNIDSLTAVVELKRGTLEITKFDTKSPDGELHVAFNMKLNQDFQSSLITGCLRFNGSAELQKREPKTHAAISTTGAPLGPDNLFHIKLDGPVRALRRIGVVCSQNSGAGSSDTPGSPPRPNLSVQPEQPTPSPGIPRPGAIPLPPPPVQQTPPAMPSAIPTPGGPPPGTPPLAAPETTGGDAAHPPGTIGESPAPTVFPSNGSSGVGLTPNSPPPPTPAPPATPSPPPTPGGPAPQ